MSGMAITRRMAFEARVERRLGALSMELCRRLRTLWLAYDPLEFRAGCARAGFRLGIKHTYCGGVARPYLVHRRAA